MLFKRVLASRPSGECNDDDFGGECNDDDFGVLAERRRGWPHHEGRSRAGPGAVAVDGSLSSLTRAPGRRTATSRHARPRWQHLLRAGGESSGFDFKTRAGPCFLCAQAGLL